MDENHNGKRKFLNTAIMSSLFLSVCLLISATFLLGTSFAVLNGIFVSIVYGCYCLAALVIVNKTPSALSVGILIGSSIMILVLSFQHTIFWISNSRKVAAVFQTILNALFFLIQFGFTVYVVKSRREVIDTYAAYEHIPDHNHQYQEESTNPNAQHYQSGIPSANI